jgi:predicted HTH transcriptional regulator
MDRSLFLLPSDKINWNDIQAFLDQHLEESSVLDYTEIKSEKACEGVLKIIVAMANTDGGIILVGVSKGLEDVNRPGSPVGIELKYVDILKNKCRSLLQPAFVPEMVQIAIPNDEKIILLIRINPERHPRPVILKTSVYWFVSAIVTNMQISIASNNYLSRQRIIQTCLYHEEVFPRVRFFL